MKRNISKVVALIICIMMLCSVLVGCGGGTESTTKTTLKGINGYIYTAEFTKIDNDNTNVGSIVQIDDSHYAYFTTKYNDEVANEDAFEVEASYYNVRPVTTISVIDLEGNVTTLENYKTIELPKIDGVKEEDINVYLGNILPSSNGFIMTCENVNYYLYTGPTDVEMYTEEWYAKEYYNYQEYHNDTYLRTLDETGNELSCIKLTDIIPKEEQDEYFWVNNIVVSGDKLVCSSDQTIFILGTDGSYINKIELENYIDGIYPIKGKLYLMSYNEKQTISELDLNTGKIVNPVECEWFYRVMPALEGDVYDFYYTDGSYLKGFKLSDGTYEPVLNWVNSDVNGDNLSNGFMMSDGRIVAVENNWDNDYENCESYLVVLTKVPVSEAPNKTIISYAGQYVDYNDKEAIIKFNRNSDEYRIEVTDYSQYNTNDDYEAGLTKLRTEILAGNMPDILNLDGLDYESLANKGLLADLYEFMGEGTITKEDIVEPIRNILEIDGHLYRTASRFNVNTCIGATSIVGNGTSWTVDEYKAALAKMPEDATGFGIGVTKSEILDSLLAVEIGNLVDWNNGTCNFDSELFKGILEFANEFPTEYDWSNYEYSEKTGEEYLVTHGQQMLVRNGIYSVDDFMRYEAAFGGDASFIGWPVSEGSGSALSLDDGLAISASSPVKQQAWNFVQTRFTKEYQEDTWQFPTNQEKFDELIKEAKTVKYQKDWEDKYVLDENGQKVEEIHGQYGWTDETSIPYYAMTDAQEAKLLEVIARATNINDYSSNLTTTIQEEAQSYFAGDKTVDEVAKLIQSKLTILVNEQM